MINNLPVGNLSETLSNIFSSSLDPLPELQKIVFWMPGCIYWKDKNGYYRGCNQAIVNYIGLPSPAEIIGKNDFEIGEKLGWPLEVIQSIQRVDKEILETAQPKLNIEERPLRVVDGKEIVLITNKVPILDKEGKAIGIIGISIDITERKKTEQALQDAKEAAEAADKLKTEFIHNMEHDIRTPFGGIFGMAKILSEKETDSEKKQYLVDISNCAKELLDYCSDILDYSNIESGTLPVLMEKFDLHQVINALMVMETPAAQAKKLTLRCYISKEVPSILIGDSHRLQRILINLISNAIKFTETGFVRLHIKLAAQKKRSATLQFIIEDSGIGMPKEKQKIIFEKFSRILAANKGSHRGKGLGLRIVNVFINELDADIDVKSEPGKGTIFICDIPFKLPLVNKII